MWYYEFPSLQGAEKLPIYLVSLGLHELQPYVSRAEGYPYPQFFYHTCGEGLLVMLGRKYTLSENMGFYIPANVPHEYYPTTAVWDVRWMTPGGDGVEALCEALNVRAGTYRFDNTAALDVIQNRMYDELVNDQVYGRFAAGAMVSEYITEFARQANLLRESDIPETRKKTVYEMHFDHLAHFIDYHYMHTITISDLCDVIKVSPQHLCRVFRSCKGMRPMEYVTFVRISNAKLMLKTRDDEIGDIAEWCGFSDGNYFSKVFRKSVGISPGEYRRINKNAQG